MQLSWAHLECLACEMDQTMLGSPSSAPKNEMLHLYYADYTERLGEHGGNDRGSDKVRTR
jgi:hypothetical protein